MSGEPVTVLSSLNDDERQAYLDFLVTSDVRFVKDSDGSYVARVGDGGGGGGNNTSSAAQSHLSSLPEGLAEAFGDGGSDPSLSRRTALLAYNRFLKFSQHLDVAYASKAKLRPVSRLIKLIDEIYQARRAFEMAELNSEGEKTGAYGVLSHRIPVFCFQFLKSKFGIKALVHQVRASPSFPPRARQLTSSCANTVGLGASAQHPAVPRDLRPGGHFCAVPVRVLLGRRHSLLPLRPLDGRLGHQKVCTVRPCTPVYAC